MFVYIYIRILKSSYLPICLFTYLPTYCLKLATVYFCYLLYDNVLIVTEHRPTQAKYPWGNMGKMGLSSLGAYSCKSYNILVGEFTNPWERVVKLPIQSSCVHLGTSSRRQHCCHQIMVAEIQGLHGGMVLSNRIQWFERRELQVSNI